MDQDTNMTPSAQDDTATPTPAPAARPAWEPSASISSIVDAMDDVDHNDKKGIAFIVKSAIDLRTRAKNTRELAARESSDEQSND